jgi:hypothetical protein
MNRASGISPPRSPRLSLFGSSKSKVVELDTTPLPGMKMKVAHTTGEEVPMYVSKVDKKLGLVTLKPDVEAPPGTEKKYLTLGEFKAVVTIILAEAPQLTAENLSQLNEAASQQPRPTSPPSKSPMRSRLSTFFGGGGGSSKSPAPTQSSGPNFGPGPIKERPPPQPLNNGDNDEDKLDDGSQEREMSDGGDDSPKNTSSSPSKKPTSPRAQTRLTPKPATRIKNASPPVNLICV